MSWQFDDVYIVRDRKTGLLVLDGKRYADRRTWYHGFSELFHAAAELEKKWCVQISYAYTWYADSDSGADHEVEGVATCPLGCETVIAKQDEGVYAKIALYAVGEGQECIGFLQKVTAYRDTDEWHFFDLGDPATHQWKLGRLVLRENAVPDRETVW